MNATYISKQPSFKGERKEVNTWDLPHSLVRAILSQIRIQIPLHPRTQSQALHDAFPKLCGTMTRWSSSSHRDIIHSLL